MWGCPNRMHHPFGGSVNDWCTILSVRGPYDLSASFGDTEKEFVPWSITATERTSKDTLRELKRFPNKSRVTKNPGHIGFGGSRPMESPTNS